MEVRSTLEKRLDSFDVTERQEALEQLLEDANTGKITLPLMGDHFNLHCHSFYSFNGYGYSPSGLAWRGRASGLCAMALIDFDVLDGVDEFLAVCEQLGLRSGAGLETRVFVPAFAEDEINSPGEPGVAYHIGMGFVSSTVSGNDAALLRRFKDMAQQRTQAIIKRVNTLLDEIAVDYEKDVLPLTPAGNATERHVCAAYYAKAQALHGEGNAAAYWASKLDMPVDAVAKALADPPVFQGIARSKTMKAGGVGYVRAQSDEFPALDEVNRLILANGAIPTFAFLDGASSGEARMDDLLDVMTASGVAAVNIIPDRNWNIADAEVKALKLKNLEAFVQQARARNLPIFVGTEMNAYGQRFVDAFDAPELRPYFSDFQEGMHILNGHTLLQAHAGMGYLSGWAADTFATTADKNRFFARLGRSLDAASGDSLNALSPETGPEEILKALPRL